MANVINRTTLQYLKSVNTPNYPESDWLINPVLPDCEQKYWRIYSGVLKEMTVLQKKAVDDAEALRVKEAQKGILMEQKTNDIAVAALKSDGVLDNDGNLI